MALSKIYLKKNFFGEKTCFVQEIYLKKHETIPMYIESKNRNEKKTLTWNSTKRKFNNVPQNALCFIYYLFMKVCLFVCPSLSPWNFNAILEFLKSWYQRVFDRNSLFKNLVVINFHLVLPIHEFYTQLKGSFFIKKIILKQFVISPFRSSKIEYFSDDSVFSGHIY
jgi:hypothetical protein